MQHPHSVPLSLNGAKVRSGEVRRASVCCDRCAGFRLYGEVGPLRMVLCEQTDGLATYEVSGLHTGASTGPQPERLIAVI